MYLDDNLWTRPNHVPLSIVYAVDRGGGGGSKDLDIGLTLDGLANTSYGLDSSLWSYMNQFSNHSSWRGSTHLRVVTMGPPHARADTQCTETERFRLEMEFVQCLSNVDYLHCTSIYS